MGRSGAPAIDGEKGARNQILSRCKHRYSVVDAMRFWLRAETDINELKCSQMKFF
jgi:hypothetical protein